VGQTVVAIGNPYGLSGTMTVGIVSARGRLLDSMRESPSGFYFSAADLIQTDAAINPGNSGGPLLNLAGEVIGINRAIRTNDEQTSGGVYNSGIGFAVPIDIVKRVTPYLIRDGQYDYPYLGITSREEMTLAERNALSLPSDAQGAYVMSIPTGSPADRAGVRAGETPTRFQGLNAGGDLITAVNGIAIRTFSDLLNFLVTNTSPGDTVELTILRDGGTITIPVELTARPQ
jgi:2-alkenal reductase